MGVDGRDVLLHFLVDDEQTEGVGERVDLVELSF